MEAMALGKCLLLSNCTGNVDLVEKGRNGEIYNSKDEAVNHILYFYLNKELTESMGLESIEICRDYFNIEDSANRYLQIYQRVRRLPAYSSMFKWVLKYSRLIILLATVVLFN
jgi:glycosyltransferase involved in cell wall biosynthesis